MRDWLRALHDELRAGEPVVRVVVAAVRGSAPREAGACMLVGRTRVHGTIGGGHLELVATRTARDMLEQGSGAARLDRFSLGASLGQCCGGIVELWLQRYDAADVESLAEAMRLRTAGGSTDAIAALASRDANAVRYESFFPVITALWLFGAGHVGKALVHVLAPLPFAINWVDSREDALPAGLSGNVRALHSVTPADEVGDMAAGDWALVMTHSHDEDFDICRALLGRRDLGWIGLIGSAPKATRFRQRLRSRGVSSADIARLVTPIGIAGIASKEPAAIAVAVAAQLLQLQEARRMESLSPAKTALP